MVAPTTPTVGGVPGAPSATPQDPATFPAYPEPQAYDWLDSEWTASPNAQYTRAVLQARGLLSFAPDGSVIDLDNKAFDNQLKNLVTDPQHLVNLQNVDRVSDIGFTEDDMLSAVYGRPFTDRASHPLETAWLMRQAWRRLTHRGSVSKLLPTGLIMVEDKDRTRVMTKANGEKQDIGVTLRYATSVADHNVSYVVVPARKSALKSLARAADTIVEGLSEFPNDEQLFINALEALNTQISGALAPAAAKAGLILTPAKLSTPAQINGGSRRVLKRAPAPAAPDETDPEAE